MQQRFPFLLLSAVCSIILIHQFWFYNQTVNLPFSNIFLNAPNPKLFADWNECIKLSLSSIKTPREFWKKLVGASRQCELIANIAGSLPIVALKNSDETKYAMLPVEPTNDSVLVTLGIGNDIRAEKKLLAKYLEAGSNITFYGADPITDLNADIYSTIGHFFPLAVGNFSGFSEASVMREMERRKVYKKMHVVHVELVYFIEQMLQIKMIDHLWLDAEYAEYGLFEIFYRDGPLTRRGIDFCQMSLEVHRPNESQKLEFMRFIKRLIDEKRFGFFRTLIGRHARLYLFNFENQYCVNQYLPLSVVNA